jgi:phosphoribosylformylglycinamidine cyclo-ligase
MRKLQCFLPAGGISGIDMTDQAVRKISYKDAGVDIEAGDALVEKIKARVKSTCGDRVVSGVGGFAALYDIGHGKLLAAGTDGVGTKLKIAQMLGKHDTIGIDLVAMCVNDVICTGASPLFFLDYFATGRLDIGVADQVIGGIVDGCNQSGMALIGGETAEMPGMYADGEYDLAGFAVGEVMRDRLVDGSQVADGDALVALPSSGLHSNGFSLVRKLIADSEQALLEKVLTPTRLYVEAARRARPFVKAFAHITGGGLANIPRMNGSYRYVLDSLPAMDDIDSVFGEMARRSQLDFQSLYQTFNMGLGLVMATDNPEGLIKALGEDCRVIGHVAKPRSDHERGCVQATVSAQDFTIV